MSDEFVIIPSRGSGYEAVDDALVLSRSKPLGALFRKHILNKGPLIHPVSKRKIMIDDAFIAKLQDNFHSGVCDIVQVPLANDTNSHSEDPLRNIGEVVDIQQEGDKVYALIDVRDESAIPKMGRAQPLDSLVLTSDRGFVPMGDIQVGDEIVDPEGQLSHVTGVYPRGVMDVYSVKFSDGTEVKCSEDHLWKVRYGQKWNIKPLSEFKNRPAEGKRTSIPMPTHLEFGVERDHYIDPYLLGLLLGDGSFRGNTPDFCSADESLFQRVRELLPSEVGMVRHAAQDRIESYFLSSGHDRDVLTGRYVADTNPLTNELKRLSLWGKSSLTKFIPEEYKSSSYKQRLALLQGLMDTDGCIDKNNVCQFYSSSPKLAIDFIYLARSLGCKAILKSRQPHKGGKIKGRDVVSSNVSYRVTVIPTLDIDLFRLERKSIRQSSRVRKSSSKSIVSITKNDPAPVQCISVSADSHLYITDGFNVTHNTLLGASALIHQNYVDTRDGLPKGPTLLHTCVTNRPYVVGLDDYQEIIAATADNSSGVILLSAESQDTEQTEENEMPKATLDELLAQLKEEFGLDVKALQASASEKEKELESVTALSNSLTEEAATARNEAAKAAETVQKMTEQVAGAGFLSLSNGDSLTMDDLVGAVGEMATNHLALSNQVADLREKDAKTTVQSDIANGYFQPFQLDAMTEIKLSNPSLYDRLKPAKPVVDMDKEVGVVPEEVDHELNVDEEITALTNALPQFFARGK